MRNNNIEYLVGKNLLDPFPDKPYNNLVCKFLEDLSNLLLNHRDSVKYPDIKTLGFWCRKKNILRLKDNFKSEKLRLGVGLVFHITPSNVPTNFAYSLIFGLLTGNSNIVKVPSKNFYQIKLICGEINKILKKKKFTNLRNRIVIVKYTNNDEYTKQISLKCDSRLIWGGNKTINSIREFKIKERAFDLSFADRFSLSIMDYKKVNNLSEYDLNNLVLKFYNDTYLVDQNACSSPHLIIWLNKVKGGKNRFWENLLILLKKKYNMPQIAYLEKYSKLCEDLLVFKNIKNYKNLENYIYLIKLKNLNFHFCNLRGKWGYFYEYDIKDINIISKFIDKSCQTITYFGVNKKKINHFLENNKLKGIDRVVPVGQALEVDFNWDGYDINKVLTRVVDVK